MHAHKSWKAHTHMYVNIGHTWQGNTIQIFHIIYLWLSPYHPNWLGARLLLSNIWPLTLISPPVGGKSETLCPTPPRRATGETPPACSGWWELDGGPSPHHAPPEPQMPVFPSPQGPGSPDSSCWMGKVQQEKRDTEKEKKTTRWTDRKDMVMERGMDGREEEIKNDQIQKTFLIMTRNDMHGGKWSLPYQPGTCSRIWLWLPN